MNARREKTKKQNQLNLQLTAQEEQRRLAEKAAQKQETNVYLAKKMSSFCFDVAKLIIGGIILTGLMKQDFDVWNLMIWGIVSVVLFISFGVYLIKRLNIK